VPSDRVYTRLSTISAPALRWAGKLNVPLYRLTGGRIGGRVNRAPVLLLTATGRRSGKKRTVPVLYLADEGRQIVIGSNAGHTREPAWSLNLKANPDAEVEIGRERRPVRARIAEGDEREDLWRKVNEQYSGFDDYSDRTDRQIAVFVLESVIPDESETSSG
jgi:F420H(2)-dependent quinone reductase